MGKTTRLTTEEFIRRSREAQPIDFGYDKVVYVNSSTPVLIYCFKHKQYFTQIADSHKKGFVGCSACKSEIHSIITKKRYALGEHSRVCLHCGDEKPYSEFNKKGKNALGEQIYQNICRDCSKAYSEKYYASNRETILENKKQYYMENKDRILRYNRDNYEKKYQTYRKWYLANADIIAEKRRDRTDWDRYIHAKWAREKRKNDPAYSIECRIRNRVSDALKKSDTSKAYRTFDLLGCTALECVEYLNTKASNGYYFGQEGIEVDHIIPCSFFDFTDPIQQKICFNYRNLQLLTKEDNIKKSDTLPDNLDELFEEIYSNI